jgi:transglutaminase-like putative cysteine protease
MNLSKRFAFALLASTFLITPARAQGPAESIPEPKFDRVDYARPREFLALLDSFGDINRIKSIANGLKTDSPEQTLMAIGKWIGKNLKYDDHAAYAWRDCGQIVDSKVYGGCADHALLYGALARACDIPTVWVKTMDADWIREFRNTGTCSSWRGHVFLEVFINGRWHLLDAQGGRIYDDYRTDARLLPGDRIAYDKGGDPRSMILSTDWERWKQQTARHFARFDLSTVPITGGRRLGTVYVVANSPVWQEVDKRIRSLGLECFSFNNSYERFLGESRGGTLIVTCVGSEPVLPPRYRERFLPITEAELKAKVEAEGQGVVRKRLDDGTRLILIFGKDIPAIMEAIGPLKLDPEESTNSFDRK